MSIWRATAHSKVNLHLGVGDAREDGYHELVTVFQGLNIADDVTLRVQDTYVAEIAEVVQSCRAEAAGQRMLDVPEDRRNLAWRAVEAVAAAYAQKHAGADFPVVDIHMNKRIPAAGGMAGGSADAAASLVLADRIYAQHLQVAELGMSTLTQLAAGLGADVPFMLHGNTMLGTGRGDELTSLMARGNYHWVMALSNKGLSTPEVFHKLDELRAKEELHAHLDITEVSQALLSGDPHRLAGTLHNDLQPAALSLRPDLRTALLAGERAGALAGIVSGSGPTIALLCADEEHALEVSGELVGLHGVRVVHTSGPAPGVEVVGD